ACDAALPSNAHTYRLLVFKEPVCQTFRPSLRSVVFVSSRETRLCGRFRFSSTSFLKIRFKFSSKRRRQKTSTTQSKKPVSLSENHLLQPPSRNGTRTISNSSEPWQALFRKYFNFSKKRLAAYGSSLTEGG